MRVFAAAALASAALGASACELLVATDEYSLAGADSGSADATTSDVDTSDAADASRNETGALVIGSLETLATGQAGPRSIAIDDTNAYWVNGDDGNVNRVPKGGGALTPFGTAAHARWLALDPSQVFWSNDTQGGCTPGIYKRAKGAAEDAGQTQVVGCTDILARVNGFGVDGSFVYWTTHPSGTSLMAVPKEGGNTITLAADLKGQPDALVVTSAAVFWINPPLETVSRYDKGTQVVTTLAAGHKGLGAITADATHVYFATTTNVFRVSVTANFEAGDAPETIASAQDSPISLALFGSQIYWVNAGNGDIARAPLSGGAPEVIIAGQTGARSIAVDATGVYFTRDTGEVARLPAR